MTDRQKYRKVKERVGVLKATDVSMVHKQAWICIKYCSWSSLSDGKKSLNIWNDLFRIIHCMRDSPSFNGKKHRFNLNGIVYIEIFVHIKSTSYRRDSKYMEVFPKVFKDYWNNKRYWKTHYFRWMKHIFKKYLLSFLT